MNDIDPATKRRQMRSRWYVVVVAMTLAAVPAAADRPAPPREPDGAAMIQGAWVLVAVRSQGIETAQIPDRAERWLDHVADLRSHRDNRDKAVDIPPPGPGLPLDTPVYRFSGGRFTKWENLRQVGEGRYRFDGKARPPILQVQWKNSNSPLETRANRVLYRFEDETMSWCQDGDRPDRAPTQFDAEKGHLMIVTFRRVT